MPPSNFPPKQISVPVEAEDHSAALDYISQCLRETGEKPTLRELFNEGLRLRIAQGRQALAKRVSA